MSNYGCILSYRNEKGHLQCELYWLSSSWSILFLKLFHHSIKLLELPSVRILVTKPDNILYSDISLCSLPLASDEQVSISSYIAPALLGVSHGVAGKVKGFHRHCKTFDQVKVYLVWCTGCRSLSSAPWCWMGPHLQGWLWGKWLSGTHCSWVEISSQGSEVLSLEYAQHHLQHYFWLCELAERSFHIVSPPSLLQPLLCFIHWRICIL